MAAPAPGGGDATGRFPDGEEGAEEGGAGLKGAAGGGAAGEAQMDYKTFLDLVLAMENKQTRQVINMSICLFVFSIAVLLFC